MSFLIDTNILLRLVEPSDPEYPIVRPAVEAILSRGEYLYYAAQNLVEPASLKAGSDYSPTASASMQSGGDWLLNTR